MGNSVRSTLGNLCGGEAAKDSQYDEDQRPVARPKETPGEKPQKESKKKKKKKNKKGKNKNGELGKIVEGDEGTTPGSQQQVKLNEKVDESEEQKQTNDATENKANDANKTEEDQMGTDNEHERTKDSDVNITIKEQTLEQSDLEIKSSDILDKTAQSRDELDNIVVELDLEFPTDGEEDIGKSADSLGSSTFYNDNERLCSGSESQVSRNETDGPDENVPMYVTVSAVIPEELGISYADDIFKDCGEMYRIFVDKNHEFKVAMSNFEESILPDCGSPEFEQCLEAYKELLSTGKLASDSDEEVDISDVNANVQSVRAQAMQLLATIHRVKPRVEKCISDAGNVDVIEYVKGKVVEGEQLGITSKFSAPGKYRRNMKQLKKAAASMDQVEEEITKISNSLDAICNIGDEADRTDAFKLSSVEHDNESAIVPTVKQGTQSDDVFAKLQSMESEESDDSDEECTPGTSPKPDGKIDATYERSLFTKSATKEPENENSSEDKLKTLLEQSFNAERSSPETMTYVIERIPERKSDFTPPSSEPMARKEFKPSASIGPKSSSGDKSPVQQIIVEEEEHNTLDFGKYVLIDPNTGDIQVMRNRSRSLDSLVSMSSNRSSLSRFGSFEFVTDFEINIAEKNQQAFI